MVRLKSPLMVILCVLLFKILYLIIGTRSIEEEETPRDAPWTACGGTPQLLGERCFARIFGGAVAIRARATSGRGAAAQPYRFSALLLYLPTFRPLTFRLLDRAASSSSKN
jgi:hypothetical protein